MDGNEPIFPHLAATCQRVNESEMYTGLTKRELFAAMAMQGSLAGAPGEHLSFETLARNSILYADALIAELSK